MGIFGKDSVEDNGWVEVWLGIDTNTLLQPGYHKIGDEIHSPHEVFYSRDLYL